MSTALFASVHGHARGVDIAAARLTGDHEAPAASVPAVHAAVLARGMRVRSGGDGRA